MFDVEVGFVSDDRSSLESMIPSVHILSLLSTVCSGMLKYKTTIPVLGAARRMRKIAGNVASAGRLYDAKAVSNNRARN